MVVEGEMWDAHCFHFFLVPELVSFCAFGFSLEFWFRLMDTVVLVKCMGILCGNPEILAILTNGSK